MSEGPNGGRAIFFPQSDFILPAANAGLTALLGQVRERGV
jgi:hypothetical protein